MIRMAELLSPAEKGSARIEHFQITEQSLYERSFGDAIGTYVRLCVGEEIMMTDTLMEWNTNKGFISSSHGDVFIGGLGIGMVIMAIQDNPNIRSITVVEKSDDVISIVKPQLPLNQKVCIIQGDVFTYIPDNKYDMIYLDIWHEVSSEIFIKQMIPLKARYNRYIKKKSDNKKRGVFCWAEENARYQRPLAQQNASFLHS